MGIFNKVPLNRLILLAAFALVGYMAWQHQQKLFADKGRLIISSSKIVNEAVEFSWNSAVELPMARRFSQGFEKWRDKTGKFVINLNSPGGSLHEGKRVIEVLDKMKRTHQVITYVGPGRNCLSMCVPIFLVGQQRIASRNSRWMFHEPSSVDFFTEEKIKVPESERQAIVDRFVERYFVNSPINRKWLASLLKMWKGKNIWRTGGQLVNEGSNIITKLR